MTFDLRTARLNAGLSQRGLAAECDVSFKVIQWIEKGHGAQPANAKKIADYFGIKVMDLLPPDRDRQAA